MSASPDLLPVYLAVGEDQLKRESVLTRIRKRVAAMGDIDFNSETIEGESAAPQDILTSCNTLPFASEKRLVVIKGAEKLNKSSQEALVEYLADPTESTVLILTAQKLAKNTRLYKAIAGFGKTAIISCEEKNARELPTRLRDMAVSKGVTLTADAASALLDAAGSSTVRLNTELEKIISYIGKDRKQITVEDVSHVVATTAEVKPWHLQDAFSKRDVFLTSTLLTRMYETGQSPHYLLSLSLSRIREMMSIKALLERGNTNAGVASAMGWPEWKLRNVIAWSRQWNATELREALISASDVEQKLKSGYDPELTFQVWLLGITKKPA